MALGLWLELMSDSRGMKTLGFSAAVAGVVGPLCTVLLQKVKTTIPDSYARVNELMDLVAQRLELLQAIRRQVPRGAYCWRSIMAFPKAS